jgi:hypothetical protein
MKIEDFNFHKMYAAYYDRGVDIVITKDKKKYYSCKSNGFINMNSIPIAEFVADIPSKAIIQLLEYCNGIDVKPDIAILHGILRGSQHDFEFVYGSLMRIEPAKSVMNFPRIAGYVSDGKTLDSFLQSNLG